jgi:hypothetical protein
MGSLTNIRPGMSRFLAWPYGQLRTVLKRAVPPSSCRDGCLNCLSKNRPECSWITLYAFEKRCEDVAAAAQKLNETQHNKTPQNRLDPLL